jgi:hypothetical protein
LPAGGVLDKGLAPGSIWSDDGAAEYFATMALARATPALVVDAVVELPPDPPAPLELLLLELLLPQLTAATVKGTAANFVVFLSSPLTPSLLHQSANPKRTFVIGLSRPQASGLALSVGACLLLILLYLRHLCQRCSVSRALGGLSVSRRCRESPRRVDASLACARRRATTARHECVHPSLLTPPFAKSLGEFSINTRRPLMSQDDAPAEQRPLLLAVALHPLLQPLGHGWVAQRRHVAELTALGDIAQDTGA